MRQYIELNIFVCLPLGSQFNIYYEEKLIGNSSKEIVRNKLFTKNKLYIIIFVIKQNYKTQLGNFRLG